MAFMTITLMLCYPIDNLSPQITKFNKIKKNSDTGNRTPNCPVKADRANRYTISELNLPRKL